MGSTSKYGRARIDPNAPEALGICDRCGALYNLKQLHYQWDWCGTGMVNKQIRVCRGAGTRGCYDTPQPQLRAITLPPDPPPARGVRPEPYDVDQQNHYTLSAPIGAPSMFFASADITADLFVTKGLLIAFEGVSDISAALTRAAVLAADFEGVSDISAALLRGVFLAPSFDGVSDITAELTQVAPSGPASMVFNGTDEALTRTLSTTTPNTTIFTYSVWVKVAAYDANDNASLFQVVNAPTNDAYCSAAIINSGDDIVLDQDSGSDDWSKTVGPITPDIPVDTWTHLVFRYDSTQGTAADRIRIYVDGSLAATASATNPAASEAQRLFTSGRQHQIGAFLELSFYFDGKLAFIDVLEGVSADPTAFAFDDGGTWTRMPYAGSYGTYGFSLDGSTGVLGEDVSGNGQDFTGVNMTGSNLDTGDLPPYTV